MSGTSLTRRRFLEVSGGAGAGLVLAFHLPVARRLGAAAAPETLNAWIRIGTDGTTTFLISESEMGQGVLTSMSQLLAEELDVAWSDVRAQHAPADREAYGNQSTGGSTSVRTNFERLRAAGATARAMLVAAAAQAWGVPADQCRTDRGMVIHMPSGRRVGYGDVADAAAAIPVPTSPALKDPSDWRFIGSRMPRLDTPAKVTGKAVFGLDVSMPGLLTALVARPPAFGGRVKSFDGSKALAVPGVRHVVEIPTGVVVAADGFWAAKKGRDALVAEWDAGEFGNLDEERIAGINRDLVDRGVEVTSSGDVSAALGGAAQRLEATYEVPYLAHAPMEPMNCTAHVRPDGCDLWVGTQAQTSAQELAARVTGLPVEKVNVRTMMLGGGFGRRSRGDFVFEAVHASKAIGAPVKIVYTREDDMRAGCYRPYAFNRLRAGLDDAGRPTGWEHRIVSPSIIESLGASLDDGIDRTAIEGAANLPYRIPSLRVTYANPQLPVSTHFWRSVGNSQNIFVVESFVDELAHAAGADPLEYRITLLEGKPRLRRALRLAAQRARWADARSEGRALGCAVAECFGSVVAQVAEVTVADDGTVRVPRVSCAIDCGGVVNPDTIEAQMESGITFALSAALHGRITIEHGAAVEGNFDSYPIVRLPEMPEVSTHIIAEGDPLGGIGELGVPCLAPAVTNAIFVATGKRIRSLPVGKLS
jgi:isoquinoline 1-oxidoreductase beta subunit